MTTAPTTWHRKAPGFYVSPCGWQIYRTECSPAYGGGTHWLAVTPTNDALDPFDTLREAKAAAALGCD